MIYERDEKGRKEEKDNERRDARGRERRKGRHGERKEENRSQIHVSVTSLGVGKLRMPFLNI